MKFLVLVPTKTEAEHWMLDRLLNKAGVKAKAEVHYLYDDQWQPPEDNPFADGPRPLSRFDVDQLVAKLGTQAVIVMGQEPLSMAYDEIDVPRWHFRQIRHTWGTVIPLFAPSKYLGWAAERDVDPEDVIGNRYKKERGTSHPPRFQGMAKRMFQVAAVLMHRPMDVPLKTQYLLDPDVERWERFVDYLLSKLEADPELVLSYDIETDYHRGRARQIESEEGGEEETIDYDKTIIRISFSVTEGEAVSIPFFGPYIPGVRRLLESRYPKLGWNSWAFDELVLAANDFPVEGLHYDGQDAWHMLYSDLPKGLEFVTAFTSDLMPWKHMSDTDPALYSAIDADAAVRNFYWIRRALRQEGRWNLYLRQAVYLHPPLHAAGRAGLLVNEPYRQRLDKIFGWLLRRKLLKTQELVAPEFKRKKLYVIREEKIEAPKPVRLKKDGTPFKVRVAKPKAPKPIKELAPNRRRENWIWETTEIQHERKICIACKRPNINRKHACKVDPEGWNRDYTKMFGTEVVTERREYKAAVAPGASLEVIQEWLKYNGFNPNSSDQVLTYMKAHRHPVGYNPKTEEDSADTKHLLKLAKKYGEKHPVYAHIVDTHRLAKAKSTYVVGMAPDKHGKVYTTYVNATTTWRLASRAKNLQNQSKRAANPYAKATRRMFISAYPMERPAVVATEPEKKKEPTGRGLLACKKK